MVTQETIQYAEQCIQRQEYQQAYEKLYIEDLANCTFEHLTLLGKSAYELGKFKESVGSYKVASTMDPNSESTWLGLLKSNQKAGEDIQISVDCLDHLVQLSEKKDDKQELLDYMFQYGDKLIEAQSICKAETLWGKIVDEYVNTHDAVLSQEQRLYALCRHVDMQVFSQQNAQKKKLQERLEAARLDATGGLLSEMKELNVQRNVVTEYVEEAQVWVNDSQSSLLQIVLATAPNPTYCKYHDIYLQAILKAAQAEDVGCRKRQDRMNHALKFCKRMIAGGSRGQKGGVATPFPFETLLRLLEVSQEDLHGCHTLSQSPMYGTGGVSPATTPRLSPTSSTQPFDHDWFDLPHECTDVSDSIVHQLETVTRKAAFLFPWNSAAQVHLAIGVARREDNFTGPGATARRQKIIKELQRGLGSGAQTAAGWILLSHLHMDDKCPSQAFEAANKGLQWIEQRRTRGYEKMNEAYLSLKLLRARSFLAMGRLDEANEEFTSLAQHVSQGHVAFSDVAGVPRISIQQEAKRGLAQTAMARNDLDTSKMLYEGLLGRALLGHCKGDDWAYAEYGWILFMQGDLGNAMRNMKLAIEQAGESKSIVESSIAEYHYRLGRIYYQIGGKFKTNRSYALAEFMNAARVDGHIQPDAFVWLGHFYREVVRDNARALKCYQRAVELDPKQERSDVRDVVSQNMHLVPANQHAGQQTVRLVRTWSSGGLKGEVMDMSREHVQLQSLLLLNQLAGLRQSSTMGVHHTL